MSAAACGITADSHKSFVSAIFPSTFEERLESVKIDSNNSNRHVIPAWIAGIQSTWM